MAEYTINTQDQQDIKDALAVLYTISMRNNFELDYCPIQQFKDAEERYNSLSKEYIEEKKEWEQFMENWNIERKKTKTLEKERENIQTENQELKDKIKFLTNQNNLYINELGKTKIGYDTGNANETLYFNVANDNTLSQTITNTALYKAVKIKDSSEYEFEFNEEKALHYHTISERKKYLEPFCEIGEVIPTANYVSNKCKGIFLYRENNFIKVEVKAKVDLIYK